MGWIITILVGALIGWLAGKLMNSSNGFWMDALIGVVGSTLGRFLGGMLGIQSAANAGSFSLSGIIFGVIGAALLIFIARALGISNKS